MEQRISLVTLGVADVARARAFYESLGWRGQEVEETVFYQAGGMALVLWGRDKLADDLGVPDGPAARFGGIALAHNVRSAAEVDELLAAAERAGATVTTPARTTPQGFIRGGLSTRTVTPGRSRTTPGSHWRPTARSPSPTSQTPRRAQQSRPITASPPPSLPYAAGGLGPAIPHAATVTARTASRTGAGWAAGWTGLW